MARSRVKMRDHVAESSLHWRRTLVSFIAIVLLMAGLFTNLYHLQVNEHQSYQTRSNDNRIKVVPIAPTRGLIYDRNGVLLAENRPIYSLEITPEKSADLEATVDELIVLLNLDPALKERFFHDVQRNRRFNPVVLVSRLDEDQVARFSINQHKFPGASIEAYLKRFYPYRDTLTHVLGYMAKINDRDVERLKEDNKLANYAATRDIGKLGVERYYEDLLHGHAGFQEVEVNNRGRVIRTLRYEPPVPGSDIYLNLDIRLQQQAQTLLAEKRGAIVMMTPEDGQVRALVSNPSYDPNLFVHGISSPDYKALLQNPDRPLINRASQGIYAPASTVKPMLSIMALNEGAITPSTRFFGGPYFQIPNTKRKFRDWRRWGHGWMDVYRAIEISADTFFYDIAYRLGIDTMNDYMTRFGFGQNSGIDLHEEATGTMPSRDWKQRRHKQPWYQGDTISVGIGQGYWTATPLQLARATSIMVDHGDTVHPRLLNAIVINNKKVEMPISHGEPITLKQDNHWNVALTGMWRVINGKEGTARRAFAKTPYVAGGKSGTAQVFSLAENQQYDHKSLREHLRDNALFIGFAPYDNPEAVVSVVLENAGGGSSQAAPLARAMLDAFLLPDTSTTDEEVIAHE
ncbi:penicillin-binding protein 2 [Oceanimonas baumannii]|uniref:Peptidoglycan D,D-transpeptidase MrdA n=1 Tax=Oceanimonas baumannii TaxID=129578 RepID=A0A235CP16_9GAMM|nr:penicillin-binding protein 2 [Oceanimonas baumannii]OYD26322.1 penicillin-binding protein 2 [Oceanimonas baumannii]TDW62020.1 penicillin-binding protein 2 [Oceanimonas baumannii]